MDVDDGSNDCLDIIGSSGGGSSPQSVADRIEVLKGMIRWWGQDYLGQLKTYSWRQSQVSAELETYAADQAQLDNGLKALQSQEAEVNGLIPGIDALAGYDKDLAQRIGEGGNETEQHLLGKGGENASLQDRIKEEGISALDYAKRASDKKGARTYAGSILEDITSEREDALRKKEHNNLLIAAYSALSRIYAAVIEKTQESLANEVFKRVSFEHDGKIFPLPNSSGSSGNSSAGNSGGFYMPQASEDASPGNGRKEKNGTGANSYNEGVPLIRPQMADEHYQPKTPRKRKGIRRLLKPDD
ncbi:MAG: hypothetical protein ABIJ21_04535 [Nanoarchaeota archaeon]